MKKLLYLTIGTLLIYSCSKDDTASRSLPLAPSETEIETTDGMTVLGNQLENPYSVNNMRRALANLAPTTRSGLDEEQIQATHYYVKFHPKTNEELNLLKQDSTILLYEYPLDYDIEVYGTYYHSPEIPDSQPTYQYASIDVEKWDAVSKIPVEFTILEELFIPDEDKDDAEPVMTRFGKVLDNALIEALVDEAIKITGNEEPKIVTTRASKWRPAGRITAYDNIVGGAIPLEQVRVRARRWFTTHVGYTDRSGYFSCDGRFERPANYSIVWESRRWDIRDGNIVQAYYNGPKKKGAWNLYISSGKSIRYATIHRAALRFYYGATNGLTQPQSSRKEKLAYIHGKSGEGINGDYNKQWGLGVWSDIRCFGKNSSGWREMSELFSTACHELGHAAHYTNARNTFGKSKTNLIESWARCVQYTLTNEEYKELRVLNKLNQTEVVRFKDEAGIQKEETWIIPDWQYNFQAWSMERDRNYTPLFIDLVDDYNQRQYYKLKGYSESVYNKYPYDEIHLLIPIVQEIVFKSKTLADVKTNLLNSISTNPSFFAIFGATPDSINQLFETYED